MTIPVALAGVSGILSVSGISRKWCKTSPSSSLTLDSTSPVRRGFGIPSRFPANANQFHRKRNLFAKGSPTRGAVRADARLRGWTKDAFRVSGITQVLLCTTSPSSSLTLDATSPSRGGFGIPSRFPANANRFHRKRNLFAKGSPARKDSPGRGRWHASAERGTAVERMRD